VLWVPVVPLFTFYSVPANRDRQDKYVCILGSLKTFGNKRHFNAQHVRTITDPNEVAYHMLKAQWVSLSLRNPGGRANGGMNGAAEVSCHFYQQGQPGHRSL
jgi:replication factor A2